MSTVIDISERLNEAMTEGARAESVAAVAPLPAIAGVYSEMDFIEYARINAASNSRLSRLNPPSTPAHCLAYMMTPPKKTEALIIGDATHCAILEPDSFDSRFVTLGRCEAIKKSDGKQCSSNASVITGGVAFCGTHHKGGGDDARQVLTQADYDDCRFIRDAVWAHPAARELLMQGTDRELSMVWLDDPSGEMAKGRIDVSAPPIETIIDLKSTISAARDSFAWSIRKFGYHRQAAMYMDGADILGLGKFTNYTFIAYEKVRPYAVAVYRLLDSDILAGGAELSQLMALYAKCRREDHWPAYSEDIEDISLPTFGGSYTPEAY
jgi:hypothetical protein